MGAKNIKLSKADYEALAAFRYALRKFLRFSEEAAKGAGITPQQHQALLAIHGFPNRDFVTIGELAERLQILHHSAVGLADRLVHEGLARRKRSGEDRRQVFLTLTARGMNVLERLSSVHHDVLTGAGSELREVLIRLGKRKGSGGVSG